MSGSFVWLSKAKNQRSQDCLQSYLLRLYEFVLAPCQLAWLEPKIDKLDAAALPRLPFLALLAAFGGKQSKKGNDGERC